MGWRTMQEWRTSGPKNGIEMLLLLHDGRRVLGVYNGYGQHWLTAVTGEHCNPVAWATIPDVPDELFKRIKHIEEERKKLEELSKASL